MPEVAPAVPTQVELVNHQGRIERSLRFGRPSAERSMGGSRRIVSFAAGAVFCLVDRRAAGGRSAEHRVAVLRAVAQGEAFTTYGDVARYALPAGAAILGLSKDDTDGLKQLLASATDTIDIQQQYITAGDGVDDLLQAIQALPKKVKVRVMISPA